MKDRVIEGVERAVLWGENREDIFAMMAANGISGQEADQIYKKAQASRISTLRLIGLGILAKGLLFMAAAMGVYLWFYYVQGRMGRGVFVSCGLGGIYGIWLTADGLARVVFASRATGSAIEE